MKKITSLIIVLAMLVTTLFCFNVTSAFAAKPTSGTCGNNVKWNLNTTTGVLTLTGKGATKDYGETALKGIAPWNESRELIKSIVVGEGITSLGQLLFNKCTVAESVSLPSTLTKMSDTKVPKYGTFRECTSLKSVTMPANLEMIGSYCFLDCTALTTVILNDKLTSIGDYAFNGCTALKSIKFPDSLTSIGLSSFEGCTDLTTVTYGMGMTETGNLAFRNASVSKINFSSTITEISPWSFYGCNFVKLEIPETITKINIRGFANCTALQEVTIHNPNCVFDGIGQADASGGKDPFNGSQQSLVVKGHSNSTAQAYAKAKGYKFVSIDACDHASTYEVITLEPTCTEKGTTTQVCDNCGFVVSKAELPAKGHTYETVETEDNTAVDGHTYVVKTCTVCNQKESTPTHVAWVEGQYTSTVVTKPSCTINGLQIDTCKICKEVRNVTLPANGEHVWEETSRTAPTCTAAGKIYYKCKNCNLTKSENIEALGHDNVQQSVVEPTCTTAGYTTYKCSRCGATSKVESTALGHTPAENSYVVTTEPTCTTAGAANATCARCGEKYDVVLDALGHDYVDNDTPVEEHPGHVYRMTACSRCQNVKSQGFVHTEWIEGEYTTQTLIQGSCTVSARYQDTCTYCNEKRIRTVEATGKHTYSYTKYDAASDRLVYTCSVCGNENKVAPLVVNAAFIRFVNSKTADVATGYLYDLTNDGVINAKDYAVLNKAVKTSKSKTKN